MEEIIKAIPCKFIVADYVREKEARSIKKKYTSRGMAISNKENINLQPMVENKLLSIVSLDFNREAVDCVNFTYEMNDGEAMSGAIAKNRNWAIATDDYEATQNFIRDIPEIQIITTIDLIKYWSDFSNPSPSEVIIVTNNIYTIGNYIPTPRHHLYTWWCKYFQR